MAQAATLGVLLSPTGVPQTEVWGSLLACNSATHLNSSMCCCSSKWSTGLGVLALLATNGMSLGKRHTFLSLPVLICQMGRTNPFPVYFPMW